MWFHDVPLDDSEGADGDTLLAVDLPEEAIRQLSLLSW